MICYIVAYLDRVNVGFAKLQMEVDLGFSQTVYGLGAAKAGFYPGVILYLTDWYPDRRRAAIVAIFMAAIPVAGIFGNPLSGWIMDAFDKSAGMRGWQWMFIIEAIPAVIMGICVLLFLCNGIREAKWLTEDEKLLLERNIEADTGTKKKNPQSLAGVFTDHRVRMMSAIYFCFVMGQYGLTFWMPTLVKATGVKDNFTTGLLSAILFLVAVVVMVSCGRSAYRHRERRWHLIIPARSGAVGFVVAAVNSIGNLAGFVSPYLIGLLKDVTHDNRSGMYMLAGMLVLAASLVLRTRPEEVNH
jgi:MFS family permease